MVCHILAVVTASALVAGRPAHGTMRRVAMPRQSSIMATADDVASIQAECMAKLEAALPLRADGFPDSLGCGSWAAGEFSGDVSGYAGEPKVGWVTRALTRGSFGAEGEIVAWVAPSYDIPHLYQTMSANADGSVAMTLDYTPRYDLPADTQYLNDYFMSQLQWQQQVMASSPGVMETAKPDVWQRTIQSPTALSLYFPSGDINAVRTAVGQHLDTWLGWWQGAAEVNRMKRGGLFGRDTKMHRMRFQSHSDRLKAAGVDPSMAESVAQAMVGPGDEQYVGLGDGGE